MDLLSDQNPLLKKIRRAVSQGTLTDDGCAIAEGVHLVEEAIAARCDVSAILVTEADSRFPDANSTKLATVFGAWFGKSSILISPSLVCRVAVDKFLSFSSLRLAPWSRFWDVRGEE